MKYTVIKRKGASLRELGREEVALDNPKTLEELLRQLCVYEYHKQSSRKGEGDDELCDRLEANVGVGKIDFGRTYNSKKDSIDKALAVMFQDFEDGLFRVYMNGEEYKELDDLLRNEEENEIVIVKLVMMAGKMW